VKVYLKKLNQLLKKSLSDTMKLFSIARLDDENWTILEKFSTYEDADEKYDDYADKFPNAYLDILEPA
jgi:peptide methionine sulfoxide reductase MsrA